MNEISINNNRNKIKLNALNKNKNVENTKTENIIIKKEKNDNLYENLNLKKNGKKKLPPIVFIITVGIRSNLRYKIKTKK